MVSKLCTWDLDLNRLGGGFYRVRTQCRQRKGASSLLSSTMCQAHAGCLHSSTSLNLTNSLMSYLGFTVEGTEIQGSFWTCPRSYN